MNLTNEQKRNFNLIELRIVNQRYVEILDELKILDSPMKNKKLKSALTSVYPILDKETKKYNELFEASEDGTTAFYDICNQNAKLILSGNLLEKNLINQCLEAYSKNPKALEGILNKILNQ